MRKQIKRFSPHQNGKVFGILMALSSLIFLLPMMVVMFATMPRVDHQGNPVDFLPAVMFLIMPIFYLIFGYVFVAISSLIYNFLTNHIGGLEFEMEDKNT